MDYKNVPMEPDGVRSFLEGLCAAMDKEGFLLHSVRFVRENDKVKALMNYEQRTNE